MREKILIEFSKIIDAMDKKMINELCKILDIENDYEEDDVIHSPNHYIGENGLEVEEVECEHIQKHKKLLSELHATYKEKNHKYGDSFTETVKKYGLIAAITRMHDKFSRIENIITKKAEDDEDERLVDSLKDLANYCLMTVMVLENEDE